LYERVTLIIVVLKKTAVEFEDTKKDGAPWSKGRFLITVEDT
jgi:hypothetical protein